MFIELGILEYHPKQRDRFVSGELWQQWAKSYPDIFDERDTQIAVTQAGPAMKLHFHEWLAAVLLYQTYGYLSLVEQYEFPAQTRKRMIIKRLLPSKVYELITDHSQSFGKVQCPNLLVYSPDFANWFFCEVKGPHDRLRETQIRFFEELARVSEKQINVIRFRTPSLMN